MGMQASKCFFAAVASVLLFLCVDPVNSQTLIPPDKGPIPLTYFDLNIHGVKPTETIPVRFYSWRMSLDIFAWRHVEPAKGKWDFQHTDYFIRQAERLGVQPLVVLQSIPAWECTTDEGRKVGPTGGLCGTAKSDADWVNYVRTVATRYKGRIHTYELWNEPMQVPAFIRSPKLLAHLNELAYRTLKEVDPTLVVATSALSSGEPDPETPGRELAEFNGAGALVGDVVSYHFSQNPRRGSMTPGIPEGMIPSVRLVENQAQGRPVWGTEISWAIRNNDSNPPNGPAFKGTPLAPEVGAAYLSRAYILGWALGLSRLYYYVYQDQYMGMTNMDGSYKAPVGAYSQTEKWLLGSKMNQCSRAGDGMWSCSMVLAGGTPGTIVWNEQGESQYPRKSIPGAASATLIQHLNGQESPIGSRITVSTEPELLK